MMLKTGDYLHFELCRLLQASYLVSILAVLEEY